MAVCVWAARCGRALNSMPHLWCGYQGQLPHIPAVYRSLLPQDIRPMLPILHAQVVRLSDVLIRMDVPIQKILGFRA